MQGDLGNSILNRQSVTSLLGPALRVTLEQIVLAMLLASAIALVVGVAAAALRGTWIDRLLMGFALIGTSVPTFWLGLVLIYRLLGALEAAAAVRVRAVHPRTRSPIFAPWSCRPWRSASSWPGPWRGSSARA